MFSLVMLTAIKFDKDHNRNFQIKMVATFGEDFVMGLTLQGLSLMKPTRYDIQLIIDAYKLKVNQLRKQKHI